MIRVRPTGLVPSIPYTITAKGACRCSKEFLVALLGAGYLARLTLDTHRRAANAFSGAFAADALSQYPVYLRFKDSISEAVPME